MCMCVCSPTSLQILSQNGNVKTQYVSLI